MTKPIVVYSSCLNNNHQGILYQKEYAILSNRLAQKAGYKTVLYADKKSKEFFKDVPFNEIKDLDEGILNQLPRTVWAAGKILTFSMQTEPFIHLDFDFFIIENNFLNEIQDKDFIVYHEEPWVKEFSFGKNFFDQGLKMMLDITKNIFNVDLNYESISLNFSMFGTCKKNNVDSIAKEAKKVISDLISVRSSLEDKYVTQHFDRGFGSISAAIMSIIIEQVIFPSLLKQKFNFNYYPILKVEKAVDAFEKGKEIGLVHLWGMKYNEKLQILLRKKVYNKNVT
jgi:hypothetical protein